jgi:hypothetical protein
VKLIRGKETLSSQVVLAPDPRSRHSVADRGVQQELVLKLYRDLETLSFIVDAVVDLRDQTRARVEKLPKADGLRKRLGALGDQLETRRKLLVATREGGQLAGEEQLREKLGDLYGAVNGYQGRPSDTQVRAASAIESQMTEAQAQLDALASKDVPALNTALMGHKLEPIKAMSREEWQQKQKN